MNVLIVENEKPAGRFSRLLKKIDRYYYSGALRKPLSQQ
jgi:hypothetical protein